MDLTLMPAFINLGTIVIVTGNGFNLGPSRIVAGDRFYLDTGTFYLASN
jgi:beta-xylosidase